MSECHTRQEGETATVVLGGEVDLSWSNRVRKEVLAAIKNASRVEIDLAAVSYIDSSGIAALVEGFQQARSKGQPFVLVRVSAPVLAVLKLARLDQVFPILESPDV